MSVVHGCFLRRDRVPAVPVINDHVRAVGFPVELENTELLSHSGFLPVIVHGIRSGFELTSVPAESVKKRPKHAERLRHYDTYFAATTHSSSVELAAAIVAMSALGTLTDGACFSEESDELAPPHEFARWALDLLVEASKPTPPLVEFPRTVVEPLALRESRRNTHSIHLTSGNLNFVLYLRTELLPRDVEFVAHKYIETSRDSRQILVLKAGILHLEFDMRGMVFASAWRPNFVALAGQLCQLESVTAAFLRGGSDGASVLATVAEDPLAATQVRIHAVEIIGLLGADARFLLERIQALGGENSLRNAVVRAASRLQAT